MMTHFIISKSNNTSGQYQIPLTANWVLSLQNDQYTEYIDNDIKIIIIGDYIGDKATLFSCELDDIPKLKGNFYAIIVKRNNIRVYTSFFNVMPIYYTLDKAYISSSISYITEYSQRDFSVDKKFILESLLFNYGFFNRTFYKEIQLLPCHHFLTLDDTEVSLQSHFETTSLYTKHPTKGSKVVDHLSDLFIKTTKQYLPDTHFDIAFTSGFDGRTLVSCATHFKKDFKTFSFGRPENADVAVPQANAKELNIEYRYFDLSHDEYVKKYFHTNAKEYIHHAPGGNGFIYAHFLHSTKEIAKKADHLLSGVVGSELFRALHLTGAVTSQALADIFTSKSASELKDNITNSPTLEVIQKEEFAVELEELIEELIAYKDSLDKELTLNQQFYIFVFEEIFRKFFGQWISTQMQYIKVRTPFLDYHFIKALLQTQYAGANNDFFTENPLKRIKGQYLYTDIIKKTNKKIYHQKTGKGYRPKDVRESIYLYKIILPFVLKRFKRKVKTPNLDNLGIISGVLAHKEDHQSLLDHASYFDQHKLKNMLNTLSPYTKEKERDTLLMVLSILSGLQNKAETKSKNSYHYE